MKVNSYLHSTTSLYNNEYFFVVAVFFFFLEILQDLNSDGARTCYLESCVSRKEKKNVRTKGNEICSEAAAGVIVTDSAEI